MGESTGKIIFINSHDYVSDVTGTQVVGCIASLATDDGAEVALYTQSLRLQHTLEMAYATKNKVTVDCSENQAQPPERRGLVSTGTSAVPVRSFDGPFRLNAIWTLE
jgi:hypothetical protein